MTKNVEEIFYEEIINERNEMKKSSMAAAQLKYNHFNGGVKENLSTVISRRNVGTKAA